MGYQVDQSGKIEQTEKATVLGAANGKFKAVILPAKEKRKLQELFRREGKPQLFIDAVFAVLLFYLLKELNQGKDKIEVDTEYPGHTKIIEEMLSQLTSVEIHISWVLVGKTSSAHDVAYKVYKKKLKIGKVLFANHLGKAAIKIAGGYLNSRLYGRIGTQSRRILKKYHKRKKKSRIKRT